MKTPGRGLRNPVFAVPCFTILIGGAGCMIGPNYVEPRAPLSSQWTAESDPKLARGDAIVKRWWEVLNDPVLNRLVETASRQNPSLHAAAVRVIEAQARRAVAFGLLFPQQQDGTGGYSWNQTSENAGGPMQESNKTLNRLGLLSDPGGSLVRRGVGEAGIDNVFQNWQFGFGASWELDVWGRYRRGIEAADAQVLATVANYDDVLVSLISEVATTYVLMRSQEEQLVVTTGNVAIQRRGYELADAKLKGGTTTALDPAQAAALLYQTEAQEAQLEARIRQTKAILCVLLGLPPNSLSELIGGAAPIPTAPERVSVGIPADLLRRRPDVRRIERTLAAQSALIGIAKSELYPRFSLNGELGLSAEHFSDLWRGNSFDAFAGPTFRWAILNYGRIENNVRVQDAAFQALIGEYENTVLRAQGEVEAAIAGYLGAQRQVLALGRSVDEAKKAVDLAEQQYRGGIADYTRVLNTQEFLTTAQSQWVATRGAVALNLIAIYRSLGGGWELRETQEFLPASIVDTMKGRTDWGGMIEAGSPRTGP